LSSSPESSTATTSPLLGRLRPWRRMAVATLAIAAGDSAFAFVTYALFARRYNFETRLQYFTSGVFGQAAFTSGWAGVGYASLGFVVHIAQWAACVVYALTIAPLVRTRWWPPSSACCTAWQSGCS
jgi:hypothetical protein